MFTLLDCIIRARKIKGMGYTYAYMRNAYKILVGKPEGERLVARPGRRWENNIKMDIKQRGYESVEWIQLA
jgi:hypothetical protein